MSTPETQKNSIFLIIVGALIGVGSFLPWAQVGFISVAGTQGDGMITLVGSAALLGIGLLEGRSDYSRGRRVVAFGIAALCAWISWGAYARLTDGGMDTGLVGGGLVLVVFASAAAAFATFAWMLQKEPTTLLKPPPS